MNSRNFVLFFFCWLILLTTAPGQGNQIFVSKTGSDQNKGTEDNPFLSINHAAQIAKPGDEIIVREGVYRETIYLLRGGKSEDKRIIFRAAEGEDVRILGSELVKNWQETEKGLWKVELDSAFFGEFNPFNTLTRHPNHVAVDEAGDGWGWLKYGRWTHLGDVIIDGKGLTEREKLEDLDSMRFSWYTRQENKKTIIWANFGEMDPNESNVELNSRPYAFFPSKAGLAFISIQGFTIMNYANHWTPPTVYQPGAIWTNGGHHWVIENNIILYTQGPAISLGLPNAKADMDKSGYHLIRNNVIMRCGQSAITGQQWLNYSQIYDNHIEEINYRREFGGWETAGIKHHNSLGLVIRNNFIRGVYTQDPKIGAAHGIWNDYANQNWKVSENVIINTEGHAILTEAVWEGPNNYERNIIINGSIGSYSSVGEIWAQNLLVKAKHICVNQTYGGRPKIENQHWVRNIFIGGGFDSEFKAEKDHYKSNLYMDGARVHIEEVNGFNSNQPSGFTMSDNGSGLSIQFSVESDALGDGQKAGPFKDLKPGPNKYWIYGYSENYKKALKIIGK